MIYKFEVSLPFKKEFKALFKKYKSLDKDIQNLRTEIENEPNIGVTIAEGIKKIRLKITSKGSGKSGGARVITHEILVEIDCEETMSVAFISIYDKSEYDTADLDIIKKIVKNFRETQQPTATKKTKQKNIFKISSFNNRIIITHYYKRQKQKYKFVRVKKH